MKKKPKLPKLGASKSEGAKKVGKIRAPRLNASRLSGKIPSQLRFRRRPEVDEKLVQALQNLPRITNETVAEHREEVLSSARKYIYPLSHSKRRIVAISAAIFVALLFGFFV